MRSIAGEVGAMLGLVVSLFLAAISEVNGSGQLSSLIPGVKEDHCSEVVGSVHTDILVCQVWDGLPELFSSPRQIELYRKGKRLQIIQPDAQIIEWHLWKSGEQIAVRTVVGSSYLLYDTATGKVLKIFHEKASTSLSEWAKSEVERSDDDVPQGAIYIRQRTQWIAKVMRKITTLHAGMMRRDLQSILTTEGGVSTRFQRTYVSLECPYIKVDIRFKATSKDANQSKENAEDIIESISKPYLDWKIMD